MAARVVAQYLKVLQQVRHLRGPHAVIAAERMGEHEHRQTVPPLKPVENPRVVNCDKGHSLLLPAVPYAVGTFLLCGSQQTLLKFIGNAKILFWRLEFAKSAR